ncbi:MAG: PadR family transcriptional regulator [Chloroflexi bacterium]|nr:PadR family transcriptional regulator [Chloroflexota bacterium]
MTSRRHHYEEELYARLRRRRLFHRGDLKYVILEHLKDKPSHGYEIIRELQERFHRFYRPSPGSIYPTLQMLEEMGYLTASEQEGKRVYAITPTGSAFLEARKEHEETMKSQMDKWWNPENIEDVIDVRVQLERLMQLLKVKTRTASAESLGHVRKALSDACDEISKY